MKVLVIGLDGATLDIIKPMVEAGRLPTFASFIQEGVWGKLRSTVLPVTPPAWTSFMTGKNPGKHGIFGFFVNSPGKYKTRLITGYSAHNGLKHKDYDYQYTNKTAGQYPYHYFIVRLFDEQDDGRYVYADDRGWHRGNECRTRPAAGRRFDAC